MIKASIMYRVVALSCAAILTVTAAWMWLVRDTSTAPVPRVLPKTAINAGFFDFITSCWAQAGLLGLGTIAAAVSAPPSLGVSVATWVALTGGAASAADACATSDQRPVVVTSCFSPAAYKGTYNGVKYYTGAGTCAAGFGGGGGGGGSW